MAQPVPLSGRQGDRLPVILNFVVVVYQCSISSTRVPFSVGDQINFDPKPT